MIDLNQIGYNVIQTDQGVDSDGNVVTENAMEITGGITLTVKIKVSDVSLRLAPDPKAVILHVKKRIREKIWDMAYGHLKEPMKELKNATGVECHTASNPVNEAVSKLEEAIGEP